MATIEPGPPYEELFPNEEDEPAVDSEEQGLSIPPENVTVEYIENLVTVAQGGGPEGEEAKARLGILESSPAVMNDPELREAIVQAGFYIDSGSAPYTSYTELTPEEIRAVDMLEAIDLRDYQTARRYGIPLGTQQDVERWQEILRAGPQERLALLHEELAYVVGGGAGSETTTGELGLIGDQMGTDLGFLGTDFRLGDMQDQWGRRNELDPAYRPPGNPVHDSTSQRSGGLYAAYLLEDLTPREARAFILGAEYDELVAIQVALKDAGLYGESTPVLGMVTNADMDAFNNLVQVSALQSGRKDVASLLSELTQSNMQGILGKVLEGMSYEQPQDVVVSLTSREALRQMGEQIGLTEMGRRPTDAAMNRAIEAVHAAERNAAQQRHAITTRNFEMANQSDVDFFLDAISGQESGHDYNAVGPITSSGDRARGRYQFMPATWRDWSKRVFGEVRPQNPENEEIVARAMALHYYDTYGSWESVASIWYSGQPKPNNSAQYAWVMGPNGRRVRKRMPSIQDYVNQVMGRYNDNVMGYMGQFNDGPTAPALEFVEATDAGAILNRELRAADEVGWQSWQFADAATNFYGLLGSIY